jgi:hypothetical protein
MKPKLKITLKTKTSFCDVELAPKRSNMALFWVVAGGLGNEDTHKHLQALKESVARWTDSLPKDVADDILGDAS